MAQGEDALMESQQTPGREPSSNLFFTDAELDQLSSCDHAVLPFCDLTKGISVYLSR